MSQATPEQIRQQLPVCSVQPFCCSAWKLRSFQETGCDLSGLRDILPPRRRNYQLSSLHVRYCSSENSSSGQIALLKPLGAEEQQKWEFILHFQISGDQCLLPLHQLAELRQVINCCPSLLQQNLGLASQLWVFLGRQEQRFFPTTSLREEKT